MVFGLRTLFGAAAKGGNKTLGAGRTGKTLGAKGTLGRAAVQYKALDVAGKFLGGKAKSELSKAVKPFFDKSKLP